TFTSNFSTGASPLPARINSTRQWLARSASVLPPSRLSRMNEFSPVMRTSLGSTGEAIVRVLLCSGAGGGDLHAGIVVAGALADVGVGGRGQRRDGLSVVGGMHPGALQAAHDPAGHRVGDL